MESGAAGHRRSDVPLPMVLSNLRLKSIKQNTSYAFRYYEAHSLLSLSAFLDAKSYSLFTIRHLALRGHLPELVLKPLALLKARCTVEMAFNPMAY